MKVQVVRVAVISFSNVALDTRVQRTINSLRQGGYEVTAIGFGKPDAIDVPMISLGQPRAGPFNRIAIALTGAPANIVPALSSPMHFLRRTHRALRDL